MTVRELIMASLRVIGELDPAEPIDDTAQADGYEAFKLLLEEWAGRSLMIPFYTKQSFNLVASQASYTIGENGSPDVSSIRPTRILDAFIRDSAGQDHYLDIFNDHLYNLEPSKAHAARPSALYYQPTAPNGTIYMVSTPNAVEALHITSLKPFVVSTSVTDNLLDDMQLPAPYAACCKWNLAVRLAPEYEKEASETVKVLAVTTFGDIESLNLANNFQVSIPNVGKVFPGRGNYNFDSDRNY